MGRQRELMESRASVFVDVEDVCKNRAINSSKRGIYLRNFKNRADISLIFRETMGRLGKIIKKIREETDSIFQSSRINIEAFLDIASKDLDSFSVCDVVSIQDDEYEKKFAIFPDFLQRATRLRNNFIMENNELHIISNRAYGHKNK